MGIWDSSTAEWHLTPKGWVRGTSHDGRRPGPDTEIVNRPASAVETWTLSMTQTHPRAKEDYSWRLTWRGNASDEKRKELHRLFRVPEKLGVFPDLED